MRPNPWGGVGVHQTLIKGRGGDIEALYNTNPRNSHRGPDACMGLLSPFYA